MIRVEDELAQDYLTECGEQLASLEAELFALEMGGDHDVASRIDRAFRALHWIKSGAGIFELPAIREAAGEMEEVLALMRTGKLTATPEQAHVLLMAIDTLREVFENPHGLDSPAVAKTKAALADLARAGSQNDMKRPAGSILQILLVEDDFASRLLLQTFLSRYGECHIAVNGREAVEAFRSALDRGQAYDLICMDIMMPEMDGREAVRRIRALEEGRGILSTSGTKIIMTTAVDEVREVVRCFRELCDAYLMKPIDLAQLLNEMRVCGVVE